jgi:hypothetical protein
MTYTPVELRHVKVGRSLFGYNRATVEQVIEEVAQSFEATWRERGQLSDQVESLEKQLAELRGREHLLTQTLVAAEQAASDVREKARREAEAIISEAHIEARAINRSAHTQREALLIETRRIEAMLRSALGIVSEGIGPAPAPKPAETPVPRVEAHLEPPPAPVEESHAPISLPPVLEDAPEPEIIGEWKREDTREFEPIAPTQFEPIEEPHVAEHEPEHGFEGEALHPLDHIDPEPIEAEEMEELPVQPVLERVPGRESRDFDWGE